LKVISFFSGAGGLDLGFEAEGYETVFACDNFEHACNTLRANLKKPFVFGPPHYSGDINELSTDFIFKKTGLKKGEVDIVIGGPPCQPFSMAAAQRFLKGDDRFKRKGFDCDVKGNLVFSFMKKVIELEPKAFVIENVPGILTIDGGDSIKNIITVLSKYGYTIAEPFILNAEKFGVPQKRQRAFIIGHKGKNPLVMPEGVYKSTNLKELRQLTVADALFDFSYSLPNTEVRTHRPESIERYKTLKFGQREKKGRVDRLDPCLPSKTVIAGGSGGGGRSHLHPYLARTMSPRECARLQTFPDDYIFKGPIGRQFTQVGNAVPPLLAENLARQVLKQFFNINNEGKPFKYGLPCLDLAKANSSLLKWSLQNEDGNLYNDITLEIT